MLGPPAEGRKSFVLSALRPDCDHYVMRDILTWLSDFWRLAQTPIAVITGRSDRGARVDVAVDVTDAQSLIATFGLVGILAILFIETGLLVGFFLSGDSLLFLAGVGASSAARTSSTNRASAWHCQHC